MIRNDDPRAFHEACLDTPIGGPDPFRVVDDPSKGWSETSHSFCADIHALRVSLLIANARISSGC